MAKWMEHQTAADKKRLDGLRLARDATNEAFKAEMLRQKSKYEQRARRKKSANPPQQ